ncbi:hypothetical protein [Vibrio neptunius]|uniref:CopG family transcriptional regulator n=1 Tax=Vibrio neptunius TaxID=170651 RepID=A0ABS2ZXA5_9VIBR|nr:hypothetical protein [Vibrio neptunius]MBN3492255.1 hypothetical protein [Vibrio neptunius]MBN3514930.1 hypothetical protein [Vibrio neptunius]MBN3549635.1 hypothetical protein [Vibrio neptunius]MBN3576880.1 hypothetical protein [Vibrio neptunius]MCH9870544.1 hypothetical protein [Vibrio neptunius]
MSRNSEYEQRQRDSGLKKITIWVPEDRECDLKLAAKMMCEDENLTVSVLRNLITGRLASMLSK